MIDELEKKQSEMLSAFPNGNLFPGNRGLTIRDYFATIAMHQIMSHWVPHHGGWKDKIAKDAYEMADAMMLAREKS